MHEAVIYRILDTVGGGSYIGSTINLKSRKSSHWSLLKNGRHPCRALQAIVNKRGLECLLMRVVERCAEEARGQREQAWLRAIKRNGKLLNALSEILPRRQSDETRRLISVGNLGKPKARAHVQKLMFFTGDKLAELLRLRSDGWGVVALAKHFGTWKGCVRRTLNGLIKGAPEIRDPFPGARPSGRFPAGRRGNRRVLNDSQVTMLRHDRGQGIPWKKLAALYKVNISTVIRYYNGEHDKRCLQ